jgi:hypothetical protein
MIVVGYPIRVQHAPESSTEIELDKNVKTDFDSQNSCGVA